MVKIYKSKGGSICNLFTNFKTKKINFNKNIKIKEYEINNTHKLTRKTKTSRNKFHSKQKLKKANIEIEIIKPIEVISLEPTWNLFLTKYIKNINKQSYTNLNHENKINSKISNNNSTYNSNNNSTYNSNNNIINNNNSNKKTHKLNTLKRKLFRTFINKTKESFKQFLITFILDNLNENNITIKINDKYFNVTKFKTLLDSKTLSMRDDSEINFIEDMLINYSNILYTYNGNLFTVFNLNKNSQYNYMEPDTMNDLIELINKYKLYT